MATFKEKRNCLNRCAAGFLIDNKTRQKKPFQFFYKLYYFPSFFTTTNKENRNSGLSNNKVTKIFQISVNILLNLILCIFNQLSTHSSEIRCLYLMKCSSEMLQNLPYFWNTKTHIQFFFIFHFVLLYFFPGLCQHRPGHSLGKK